MKFAIWTEENEKHLADHGVSKQDAEFVINHPTEADISRSSGRPIAFGYVPDGRFVAVVYEEIDEMFVYPITAYEV
jgi:uncharacterized DUF497 family protein